MICACGKQTKGGNRRCPSCKGKASYARHKAEYSRKAKLYYLAHRNTIKSSAARWQRNNPVAHYQIKKRYDARNPVAVRERQRRFYARHSRLVLDWNRKGKLRRKTRTAIIQLMTMTNAVTVKSLLDEAFTKINAGAQTIKEGCELYVKALDQDLEASRKFMREHGITDEFLDLFEAVGRGRIHPRLLVMPCPANIRLQRAPLAEQERLLSVGVELMEMVNGEAKIRIKPVSQLTKLEAATAIDTSGNVPRDIQIERLKRRQLGHTFKMPPYSLDGDVLYARENSRIPFEELKRLYLEAHKYHEKFIEMKNK